MRAAGGRDPGNDHAGWLLPEPRGLQTFPSYSLWRGSEQMMEKHLELFDEQFFFLSFCNGSKMSYL